MLRHMRRNLKRLGLFLILDVDAAMSKRGFGQTAGQCEHHVRYQPLVHTVQHAYLQRPYFQCCCRLQMPGTWRQKHRNKHDQAVQPTQEQHSAWNMLLRICVAFPERLQGVAAALLYVGYASDALLV